MLIIETNNWIYQTEETKENIENQIKKGWDIIFKWMTKEVSLKEWEVQSCTETITLYPDTKILAIKEYTDLWEPKKAKQLTLEEELNLIEKEIEEKEERKEALEKALDDEDFIKYREHKIKSLEYQKKFLAKWKKAV